MNILLIGSGGREHALAWKIAQSPLVHTLIVAPGNAGTDGLALANGSRAQNLSLSVMDFDAILDACRAHAIDLVVIGPDDPLAAGLADRVRDAGILAFGPSQAAAQLEASKSFAKAFMARHAIPTAAHGSFTNASDAKAFLDTMSPPYVLKADGLAAGKGVVITADRAEAETEIDAMLAGKFGDASKSLVIEEFMQGQEASVFVLTDGLDVIVLPPCQDHKRAFDGDEGPNTGGMGAYCPTPAVDAPLLDTITRTIIAPTIHNMAREGTPFSGVLYVGLMLTPDGPKVVEYNARFGDPECQVLMTRMAGDIVPYLLACANGQLGALDPPSLTNQHAATVILATKGYPGSYDKGSVITGLDRAEALDGVTVFHAGTKRDAAGTLTAHGGRMLNVTATGDTLRQAIDRAYAGVNAIDWPEGFCRRDIGWRAL